MLCKENGDLTEKLEEKKKNIIVGISLAQGQLLYIYFDLFPSGLPPPQYSCK